MFKFSLTQLLYGYALEVQVRVKQAFCLFVVKLILVNHHLLRKILEWKS